MMNAFTRGHAITALEELSLAIVQHCVCVSSYKENPALKHWEGELSGYVRILQRLNKGKMKSGINFTTDIITEQLLEHLIYPDRRETIEAIMEGKSLDPERIDWKETEKVIEDFAKRVMGLR